MARLQNLGEWKALEQTTPSFASYVLYAESLNHGGETCQINYVEETYLEVQVIRSMNKQRIFLHGKIEQECVSKLTGLLELLESIADKRSIETALSNSSERLPVSTFPEHLRTIFPNLSKLVQCTTESDLREHMFRIDLTTATTATWQHISSSFAEVNRFLNSINGTIPSSYDAPQTTARVIDPDHDMKGYIENVLDKLQSLFSECKTGDVHRMMVQLACSQDINKEKLYATLDLLLSSCISNYENGDIVWQKASFTYPPKIACHENQYNNSSTVNDLCSKIQTSLGLNEHLRLNLFNGELISTENTDIGLLASQDDTTPGVSLHDLILAGHFQRITWESKNRFTIWEKRKLALNLGLLFMYLHDCKWTKYGWKPDKMHFLESLASHQRENVLQTAPYLDCGPHPIEDIGLLYKGSPDFLLFGKLLLELEFGEEIKATERDKYGRQQLYITLTTALGQAKKTTNKYYADAVSASINLSRHARQEEPIMDQIRSNIIMNLEKELACLEKPSLQEAIILQVRGKALSSKDIENSVFSPPASLDLGGEGSTVSVAYKAGDGETHQVPYKEKTRPWNFLKRLNIHRNAMPGKTHTKKEDPKELGSSSISLHTIKKRVFETQNMGPLTSKGNIRKISGRASKNIDLDAPNVESENMVRLFDGSVECLDSSQRKNSEEFFDLYNAFKRSFLQGHMFPSNDSSQREANISVCVIDTGIDKSHPAIKGGRRRNAIRECRSWIGDPGDIQDECGHGTHVTQLILEASDNVDIYVAKISNFLSIDRQDIGRIAEAITYANIEWDVDIITMSFGFPELDLKVEAAIKAATGRGKLLFASASNHGNNTKVTYPARHGNVICINASNGKGKDGGISPAPIMHDPNFMTLGTAIPLLWKGDTVYKSGTSYATPIAVGFAVNILELVRQNFGEEQFKRLKYGDDLMKRIFLLMSERDNGYDFIAPWRLWGQKSSNLVNELIGDELGCTPIQTHAYEQYT